MATVWFTQIWVYNSMTPATISLKKRQKTSPSSIPWPLLSHSNPKQNLSEKTGEDRSLPETDMSHLWKRKIIFPSTFKWDILVSRSFKPKNTRISLNKAKHPPPGGQSATWICPEVLRSKAISPRSDTWRNVHKDPRFVTAGSPKMMGLGKGKLLLKNDTFLVFYVRFLINP